MKYIIKAWSIKDQKKIIILNKDSYFDTAEDALSYMHKINPKKNLKYCNWGLVEIEDNCLN